jgi:hypothetical protein
MVDIIHLNDDPHARTQLLLPWYVNGTLADKEAAQVARHLTECAECREDLEAETSLAREVRGLPRDADRGWAALRARVDGASAGGANAGGARVGGAAAVPQRIAPFSRRIPLRWAVAAQAASFALLIPILALSVTRPQPLYRTLGSASGAATGNLIVIFKPEASEAALRTILTQNQARIVDGPTSTDAYVLHVAADRRAAVLARLKGDRNVSLVEPIDGDLR